MDRTSPLRPAQLGFALYFCAGFADGIVVPFFPLWAQHDGGIAVAFIGLLFACYAGGELIATPIIGGIADRIGRRPVLIASSLGVGAGFIALFFAHGTVEAAALLLVIGIFECVLHPTIATVIAETTSPERHRRAFGVARVCSSVGRVAGPAVGALVVRASIGSVFLAAGAVLVAGGLLMMLRLPETLLSPAEDDEEETLAALLPAFRDRRLALLLLWFMLLEIAGSWIEAVLPLYAVNVGLLTASGVGLLFTFGAGLVALGQLPVTRIAEARSAMMLVLAAGGILSVAFCLLLGSPGVAMMIGAVALFSLSQMLTGPLIPTTVNQLAPSRLRATYMAAASVASDLRDTIGPATGTALYAVSARLPWAIGMPFAAIAAAGLATSIARHERATPSQPSEGRGRQ